MPKITRAKNIANHVAIVLDASSSMDHLRLKVIEVVDRQVKHLAMRSQENNQETRISIWVFSGRDTVECVVWDMDVLRLPSIAEFYRPDGMTALVDAVLKSIDDLSTVSEIYGDHSFLMYVFTDGDENNSRVKDPSVLSDRIKGLPDNWTVATLVPNISGVMDAKRFGFPAGNIQMWDATSEKGLEEAAQSVLRSTDAYMTARSTGMRSTTGLFDMSAAAVNKQTIQAAGLTPLESSEYMLVPVVFRQPFQAGDDRIDTFTTNMGHQYVVGRGFYQLTLEPVKVQVNKEIAVVEKKSGKVYVGKNARALLGMPDMTVTLRAAQNPEYDIFIQSTSLNRKLLLGSKYLYLTPNVTYVRGQAAPAPQAAPQPKVAKMPPVSRSAPVPATSKKVRVDLNAPVYSKGGKATWALVGCPACSAVPLARCKNSEGSLMEKPHKQRKV